MLPGRVLNPGPLTDESGALPIALRGPAELKSAGFRLHFEFGGTFLIFVPSMYSSIYM